MDVGLRSLKAFLSVVEAGGFSATARAIVSVKSMVLTTTSFFGEFFVNIDELLIDPGSRCSARRLHGVDASASAAVAAVHSVVAQPGDKHECVIDGQKGADQ